MFSSLTSALRTLWRVRKESGSHCKNLRERKTMMTYNWINDGVLRYGQILNASQGTICKISWLMDMGCERKSVWDDTNSWPEQLECWSCYLLRWGNEDKNLLGRGEHTVLEKSIKANEDAEQAFGNTPFLTDPKLLFCYWLLPPCFEFSVEFAAEIKAILKTWNENKNK